MLCDCWLSNCFTRTLWVPPRTVQAEVCCGYDTPWLLTVSSLLHIDDEPDLRCPRVLGHAHPVKRGRLHDRACAVAGGVDRFALKDTLNEPLPQRVDIDGPDTAAPGLLPAEALVDEAHQECLGTITLGAHLAGLAHLDTIGGDDERQHADRCPRKGLSPRRAPGTHANVGLDLEVVITRWISHRA